MAFPHAAPALAPLRLVLDQARRAPAVCWKPARVKADLALAQQLMAKLDAEKGIAANPVAAHAPSGEQPITGAPLH